MEFGDIQGQPPSATTYLAKVVTDKFTWCRNLRFLQQEKWLNAKMSFDGIDYYSNEEEANQSGIFLNFTQMKTMAAYSQIMSTMGGQDGYPWSIKPTPDPTLVQLGFEGGKQADKEPNLPEELKQKIKEANMACDGMRVKITDQLSESHWEEKFSRGVMDLVTLGTMVVKGPFSSGIKKESWSLEVEKDDSIKNTFISMFKEPEVIEKYVLKPKDEDPIPDFDIISPFEFYPDPSAFTIEDCMWAIHRRVLNKSQLMDLSKVDGFDAEEIYKVIENNPKGNWTAEVWESRVYALNQRQTPLIRGDRYVALEYWGYLSAKELQDANVEIPKNMKKWEQFMCCVWTVGNHCIKIAISSMEKPYIPFLVCPYEKVLYNIWGRGVPEKMRDPQDIVNAAARAMVDNMGIAAGPQVIYDTSRMVNGFKFEGIKPWGVWPLKTLEGITAPPVTFVPVPSILGDLKALQDNFKVFIQEVTSMPDMTSGFSNSASGQHNRTAGGMSMLFNAATTYIKGVIFNLDNYITKPMIRRMYDWNMQFSSDLLIKGDFNVDAGGVQRIISNENKMANMQELLQLMQDKSYQPYINKEAMLKEWVRIRGFDASDIINSDSQAQQNIQNQMEQEAAQAQMNNVPAMRAEIPRPDALLEILQKTDKNSPAYPGILEQALLAQDAMSDSLAAAIDVMKTNTFGEAQQKTESLPQGIRTQLVPNEKNLQRIGGYPQTAPKPPQQPQQQPQQSEQVQEPEGQPQGMPPENV